MLDDGAARVREVLAEVRHLRYVDRREEADDDDEDEQGEEGERDVVAAQPAAREHPWAAALDPCSSLLRRQLGGGVESELLLAGGRHGGCVAGSSGGARRRTVHRRAASSSYFMHIWARSSLLSSKMSHETSIFEEKNDVRMPLRYGASVAFCTIRVLSRFAH